MFVFVTREGEGNFQGRSPADTSLRTAEGNIVGKRTESNLLRGHTKNTSLPGCFCQTCVYPESDPEETVDKPKSRDILQSNWL